jgi:endonuclease YncB( thermonuclease family)
VSLPDGGQDLAASLLAAGWAQVFEQYPVSRTPEYQAVQAAAQAAENGGWAMCGWLQ